MKFVRLAAALAVFAGALHLAEGTAQAGAGWDKGNWKTNSVWLPSTGNSDAFTNKLSMLDGLGLESEIRAYCYYSFSSRGPNCTSFFTTYDSTARGRVSYQRVSNNVWVGEDWRSGQPYAPGEMTSWCIPGKTSNSCYDGGKLFTTYDHFRGEMQLYQ